MKNFNELSEREILALAISLEEEDERVYADFAEGLRDAFPGSATVFESMRKEESEHRRRLIEMCKTKFGEHIPLIRRQDVKGFVQRTPRGRVLTGAAYGHLGLSAPPRDPTQFGLFKDESDD